jgi:hypothetical protein
VKKEKTFVKGVRATDEFWKQCETVSKNMNVSRNELIVSAVSGYCKAVNENNVIVGTNDKGENVCVYMTKW